MIGTNFVIIYYGWFSFNILWVKKHKDNDEHDHDNNIQINTGTMISILILIVICLLYFSYCCLIVKV